MIGRGAFVLSVVTSTCSIAFGAVSCAGDEPGHADDTVVQDGSTLPPDARVGSDAGDTSDAAPCHEDAGCSPAVPCEQARLCPVATPVSERFALTSVWGTSATDVWAVGSGGTVVHFDGRAWASVPVDTTYTLHTVTGSMRDVWLVSTADTVFHATGWRSGMTAADWEKTPADTSFNGGTPMFAAFSAGPGSLRIGGGTFYAPELDALTNQFEAARGADGGTAWAPVAGSSTIDAIWGSSPDDLWLVSDNRSDVPWQIARVDRGVRSGGGDLVWSTLDTRADAALHAIWGSSRTDVWAVGERGMARHLIGDGLEFAIVDTGVAVRLNGIWGSGPSDVWAVGDAGTILHWDGARWQPVIAAFEQGKRPNLYGVWGSGPSDVWVVGDGVALHTRLEGAAP